MATASVPVMAEQPLANALHNRKMPMFSVATPLSGCTSLAWGRLPVSDLRTPTPISSSIEPMKMYVGLAKSVPLSLRPRRLMIMTSRMNPAIMCTDQGWIAGNAEYSACTPAETLTDTVRT